MYENRCDSYNQEVKVNLTDVVFYLLGHWRTLVGAIFAGLLLGTGIFVLKNPVGEMKADNNDELLEADYAPDERTMDLAYKYRLMFYRQTQYNKDSILMQIDPIAVYTGKLEYCVKAGDNTRVICELLKNILDDKSFLEEIKRTGKLDCDLQYIREILDCSLGGDSDFDIRLNADNEIETVSRASAGMVVNYTILYTDENVCQAMLQALDNKVIALSEQLQEQYGEYEFINTNNTVHLAVDGDLLSKQRTSAELGRTFLNNLGSIENSFSDKDKEYYEAAYLEAGSGEEEVEDAVLEMINETPPVRQMIKWLMLGMVLTCAGWGGYYFIKYLLDTHLKSFREMKDTYGLQILGRTALSGEKQKGIDGLLALTNCKRKGRMDSVEYIALSIKTLKPEHILLCLNQEIDELRIFADEVKKYGREIAMGAMVHENCEALRTAKQAVGIILAVAVEKTTHEEIRRTLDVCRLQNIPVLGVVVVEKM